MNLCYNISICSIYLKINAYIYVFIWYFRYILYNMFFFVHCFIYVPFMLVQYTISGVYYVMTFVSYVVI